MKLPARTANTMSDAISMSSPNGRFSKRSKKSAEERLCMALFGTPEITLQMLKGESPQHSEKVSLLRHAATLRDLASRGMSTKKYNREAERLETEAEKVN